MAAESEDVELTPEDKKYLKQLAQDHREQQGAVDEQGRTWTLGKLMGMGFTRRDAMAILSGIAVGIPFSQAVMQRVRAAASTSDSDGNVGLPADRVDVFADGIDIASDVVDDSGNTLIQESTPAWMQQVGTSSSPVSSVHTGQVNDSNGDATLGESVASGSVTLSSGSATVDTGVSESTTATFYVALGPDTDDAEVAASIDANSGGNYEVHIDEVNTSVGNPTVRYDIVRVR